MSVIETFAGAEAAILEAAVQASGFDDFGEPLYLEGLRRLLAALDSDLPRGAAERQACFGAAVAPLVARLYAQAGWTANPGCLATPIRRPLFVVGAPRTGTTALHKLLAAASDWQGLESWLIRRPMMRPPRSEWAAHPAYKAAVASREERLRRAPALRFIHDAEAHEVDECMGVTSQTMISNSFGSAMHVPSYDAWFRAQDFRPVFRRLADNLRLIGAAAPDKRWLLKNPSHLLNLEQLLEVFPGALVVHTHRDPVKSMPSLWNLLLQHRRVHDGAAARPGHLPARDLEPWRAALMRSIGLAKRYPDRILDVYEDDLVADPVAMVARVFDFAREPLPVASERAVGAWVAANPKDKHGVHSYAAEEFGVSAGEIAERFAEYRAHHGFGERAL